MLTTDDIRTTQTMTERGRIIQMIDEIEINLSTCNQSCQRIILEYGRGDYPAAELHCLLLRNKLEWMSERAGDLAFLVNKDSKQAARGEIDKYGTAEDDL